MGILKAAQVTLTPVGGAGAATANADTVAFDGEIEAIYADYTTQPATTDVTITDKLSGAPVLTLTNVNADGWYFPRKFGVDSAGAALTGNVTPERYTVSGGVNVLLAQGDAIASGLKATIFYRR